MFEPGQPKESEEGWDKNQTGPSPIHCQGCTGSAADVIINLETLKKIGVVDEDFPMIKKKNLKKVQKNFQMWQ